MDGDPVGGGRAMVRRALESMRYSTSQVHGLVAHVVDHDMAASSLILGPHWQVAELLRDERSISSLECLRTTAPGVALEVVTYLRKEYGPLAPEVRMRVPGPDSWRTSFAVRRVPEPWADDPVTFEYLLEVPDEDDPRWEGERPTVGKAALSVIRFVAAQGFNVSFVHAPASPPAGRGEPCEPHGPCARVGVDVPRSKVRAMMDLGEALIGQIADEGLHLWVRDTETPDGTHDAWRRMYPPTHEREASSADEEDGDDEARAACAAREPREAGAGKRLAITCIGPARRGVTARLAQRFADADSRVRAVTAVKLDELTVAHGVVDAESLPARAEPSGVTTLHELLGVDAQDDGLAGFEVFWSELDAGPDAATWTTRRRVLWLRWTIRTPYQLSPRVVLSAWTAVRDACDRWTAVGPEAEPHLDYVISRVTAGGVLRGRAKVSLCLEAVKSQWPEEKESGRWLRRFCAEVEDRWRTDLQSSLELRRADLVVGWSESWLAARPALRR